jgi:cytochrome c oxidase assembly protein subunit 15
VNMTTSVLVDWIRRLALAGVLLGFCVVVMGAYVRLSAAGLGCPDWPGCYGHITPTGAQQSVESQAAYPNRPLEVGKAWREMIHRYGASTLGLICVGIAALAVVGRRSRPIPLGYGLGLFGIVVLQGILGMLTVTWRLKPLIVTLHLLFGLTTVSLLWWLWLSVPRSAGWGKPQTTGATSVGGDEATASGARLLILLAFIVLAVQIALGGWTSSNYAAVACPDFPKCQTSWWPQTDYRNAFVLWRGLGIDYEGGILNNSARVAIHLTHRIGAIVATLALTTVALVTLMRIRRRRPRVAAAAVLTALVLQLCIGIAMVLRGFPLWLATAHNAGATLLLLATLALAWTLWSETARRRLR